MPTGVEEAAAIVSLVSLAFQCLSGCIAGYQLLNTALHLGRHAAYLHCALLLEENRLLLWAKRSGLAEGRLDKKFNVKLVLEILSNLENLLCDADGLRARYKFDIKFKDPPAGGMKLSQYDPMSAADFNFMVQHDVQKERERIIARGETMQKKAPMHKQFWFAAVDKARFSELINEIDYLNTGLQQLLDQVKQEELEADIRLQRLQGINLAIKLNDIQNLIEGLALTKAEETKLAELKKIRIHEVESNDAGKDESWSSGLQNLLRQKPSTIQTSLVPMFSDLFSSPENVGSTGLHAVREYDGQRVYVEWKKYGWAARDSDMKKKVLNSIASLALLLNAPKTSKFRTLHCASLVEDANSQSYQLVYNWPLNCDPKVKPRSLRDYLDSRLLPSLTDRIQLARDLASSIFLFHTANWLHKNICSDNIIFFSSDPASPKALESPYIVGFEYSRLDAEDQPSERYEKDPELDIYRHPEYMNIPQPRFRKNFDIYSFGLVLVEIAKWRPLKYVYKRIAWDKHVKDTKNKKQYSKQEAQGIQDSLFEKCDKDKLDYMRTQLLDDRSDGEGAADIAFKAGSAMNDVVSFCLGHELDTLEDAETLQAAYFEKIIKRLDSCHV
ncbi:hypothetical protein H2198_000323 [Neophaeococcomyces mojaviensis]|uniref:Uncharacterized protein n=1 Tax=Neophaeococcomyces mojaviensis TaxID=3383035 RepID=A0ACC3AL79_9EURO|nr:hypothetical protein H2198_000323 [Knufia sp. JES_112]